MFSLFTLWLTVWMDYLIAAALIAGGGYLAFVLGANPINPLAKLFHWIGLLLIAAGILIGAVAYGKSVGASDCEAAWKAKNYEAQIDRLKQENSAQKLAADTAAEQAQQLASQANVQQSQIDDYKASTDKLSSAIALCRRASSDDDQRVCLITGRNSAGCKPAK